MARTTQSDLAPFSNWIRDEHTTNDTTRNTYVSLVRAVLTNSELTEEAISEYVTSRQGSTASTTRTAWRLFANFCASRGIAIPNPFRQRRLISGLGFNLIDMLAEAERQPRPQAQEVISSAAALPTFHRPEAYTPAPAPPKPEKVQLPEELRVLLRKWIRPMIEEIQKVGHRLSWRYTYHDDIRNVWQTAHPTVRHGWINMPEELVHALAVWTHGSTEKPEDGPLIPSQPGGSEPFPTLLLLRQIEV
jgi:hypothetical protein